MVMDLRGIGQQAAVLILVVGLIGGSVGLTLLENVLGTAAREVGGVALTAGSSLVGTSTTRYATQNPNQQKSFYANGRFWVFYSDGNNMVYSTSTDGSTWTAATTVRTAAFGYRFSVWFDGTYLHYAYASGGNIYYRRGTPNADGTITWSANEQTVSTTSNAAWLPMIAVDSNGYVWIGYRESNYPYVIKNSKTDGTWNTATGFPYQLSTTSASGWYATVIPLTAGKMLAVYAYGSATVKAKAWNGTAWGTEKATTSAIYYAYYHCAVAQGDNVHLVFLKSTGYDILYTKYSYSTNTFSSETTLRAGATSSSAPVISINPSTNDLYVFWAGSPTANHIYYRKYTASTGTWEAVVDWINESTETLTGNDLLTCFYQAYSNKIGLVYMTKTESPYNVKFAYLQLNSPPNAPTLDNPAADWRFNPSASVTFSWTFSDSDSGDSQSAYQFQIAYDSAFTNLYLDTGKVMSTSTSTTRTLPSTVGLYYWRVKTWDSQNAEGPWSPGREIIVDRVKVDYISALDYRVDVGSTAYITIQLLYEYDGAYVTSGSFTLNSLVLTYAEAYGQWQTTDARSSVQAVTYNSVSGTEGVYGLTVINMNGQSATVIWDRIKIVEGGVTDIDTKTGGKVWYKAVYEYDGTPFDDFIFSTLYLNGQRMAWAGDRWTYAFPYQMSGNQAVFHITRVQDTRYGLTVINNAVGDIVLNWATAQVTINKP